MDSSRLLAFSDELAREGVLFSFSGPFSHTLIEEFGRAIRNYLSAGQTSKTTTDVFSVYVEQAQNIQRYMAKRASAAADAPNDGRPSDVRHNGIVLIARAGEHFAISSGNRIAPEDIAPLRARLDALRDADKATLKAMYKTQLRAAAPADAGAEGRGGAGLGFLSMARAASAPLDYSVQELESGDWFFSLRVLV